MTTSKYEEYINKAEFVWYKGNSDNIKHYFREAITWYNRALGMPQSGSITKKRVQENIDELKEKLSELSKNDKTKTIKTKNDKK